MLNRLGRPAVDGSVYKESRLALQTPASVFDVLDHTCLCWGTTSHSTQRGSTIIEQSGTVHCAAFDELNAPSKDIQIISDRSSHSKRRSHKSDLLLFAFQVKLSTQPSHDPRRSGRRFESLPVASAAAFSLSHLDVASSGLLRNILATRPKPEAQLRKNVEAHAGGCRSRSG